MRIKKWSNRQLQRRLVLVHEMLDAAQKLIDELAGKLKRCQEWTTEREALVKTPTIEQIADIVSGTPKEILERVAKGKP